MKQRKEIKNMRKGDWYLIDGKWIHYKDFHLNGKRLTIKEIYDFESKYFDLIYN